MLLKHAGLEYPSCATVWIEIGCARDSLVSLPFVLQFIILPCKVSVYSIKFLVATRPL